MNPLKLISQFLALSQEQHDAVIKFCIAVTFCFTVVMMVGISLYSVVFVTQPMNGMAPADKQFFLILSDMSKYILGSLATLLAVKGKEQFIPPNLSKPEPEPPAPRPAPVQRAEPTIEPISSPVAGYNGKPAPVQPPHPEIS